MSKGSCRSREGSSPLEIPIFTVSDMIEGSSTSGDFLWAEFTIGPVNSANQASFCILVFAANTSVFASSHVSATKHGEWFLLDGIVNQTSTFDLAAVGPIVADFPLLG